MTSPAAILPSRPPNHPRRFAVALSVVGSLAVNAALLGGLLGTVPDGRVAAEVPESDARPPVRLVPPRSAVAAPAPSRDAPRDAPPASPVPAPARSETRTSPPSAMPSPSTRVAANPPPQTTRYYRIDEVDRPATPDSDWNLDTAVLDGARIERLVFDIFVNASGQVVDCTILIPATLPDATRRLLEARLRETVLQPATRSDRPVASVRRIEVSVLPSEGSAQ